MEFGDLAVFVPDGKKRKPRPKSGVVMRYTFLRTRSLQADFFHAFLLAAIRRRAWPCPLHAFAPILVRVALELDGQRAIGVQRLRAGPADGVAHSGFGFDLAAQDQLLTVHSGRQKK